MRFVLVVSALLGVAALVQAQSVTPASPCGAPEYRQFDFWLGEWDVFNPSGVKVGESRIERIIGSCVLLENYTGRKGYEGKSFNVYDAPTKLWRQFWVDNGGAVLEFSGRFRADTLEYRASTKDTSGTTLHRLSFYPLAPDSVRQLWEQSKNEGASWNVAFDGRYVRKR